jgi:hypothetical protein
MAPAPAWLVGTARLHRSTRASRVTRARA